MADGWSSANLFVGGADRSCTAQQPELHKEGAGALLLAYSPDSSVDEHWSSLCIKAAKRFKELNPSFPIAIATNEGFEGEDRSLFDHVILVEDKHLVLAPAERADGIPRQWFTRLYYLTRTPFRYTLAVDCDVTCCSKNLTSMLSTPEFIAEDFDFAYNMGYWAGTEKSPANSILLYKWTAQTEAFLKRWFMKQFEIGYSGDDQYTLQLAVDDAVSLGLLKYRKLKNNFAMQSCGLPLKGREGWPVVTRLLAPGPVSLVHPGSHCDKECVPYNSHVKEARVFVSTTNADGYTRGPSVALNEEEYHVLTGHINLTVPPGGFHWDLVGPSSPAKASVVLDPWYVAPKNGVKESILV